MFGFLFVDGYIYIYEEAAVIVLVFKRKIELNPLLLSFTVGLVTA